jgi:outer membrane protein OmpA-like peptidoglycan-associated protein/tetratricopeptide (TPR) repeat protein
MKQRIFFTIIMAFAVLPNFVLAQCTPNENKKAQKYFEKGIDKKNEIRDRQEYLHKALEENADFAEVYFELGNCAITLFKANGSPLGNAKSFYNKAVELCPDIAPYPYFYLAEIAFGEKDYAKAAENYKKFINFNSDKKKPQDEEVAMRNEAKAKFYTDVFAHPVEFNPKPLTSVDTYEDEFLANLSPDNELLIYTHRYQKKGLNELVPRQVEELTQAKLEGDEFVKPSALSAPFNMAYEGYGGATFSIDNQHLYITICKPEKKTGYVNCDIYTADIIHSIAGDKWSELRNLGPNVNTADGWESQPSLSADGKSLYFASARADSKGMDIYVSKRNAAGEWGPAENLGAPINTEGNEKSPFIHSDSHTLYFSSDKHPGVGKYDIFYSKADEKGKMLPPKNIGVPINTDEDDVGLVVSTNGEKAFISSNQLKGKGAGAWDVFSFDLHKEARPDKILFLKGQIKSDDGKPIAANIELKGTLSKEVQKFKVDSATGSYAAVISVKQDEEVVVTVQQEGKAFTSNLIKPTEDVLKKPVKQDFKTKTIELGKAYNIDNILYNTNSSELTAQSKVIIESFADYLKSNESLKVEIGGHTDNLGVPKNNLALSADRAFTVMALLQELGIAKERLSFKGFGDTKPVADNSSEEGRQKNRRTEFLIVGK